MDKHFLNIDPATVKGPFCLIDKKLACAIGVISVERYQVAVKVTRQVKNIADIMNADPQLN